ncbi:MAG: hypothetical protein RIS88_1786 [Pseudomonadota bacterium]
MQIRIDSADALGLAVRAARKHAGVRLDDLAATAGVSKQFTTELEHGKPGIRLGLALKVLHELGLDLCVDLPDECADDLHALRERGLRPLKPRDSRPAP